MPLMSNVRRLLRRHYRPMRINTMQINTTHIVLKVLVAWALASCLMARVHAQAGQGSALPFWRLDPIENSGLKQPTQRVVGDQDEFIRLWGAMWANYERPPEPPAIDFSKEAVVVLALGQRNTGGYGIRAAAVTYVQGSLEVVVVTSSPGPGCVVTASFTSPVELLRVSVPAKSAKFHAQATTVTCIR